MSTYVYDPGLRRAMLTPEQRLQPSRPATLRATSLVATKSTSSTSPGRLGGYVALWDSLSGDLGGFREKIARGAFSRTLAEAKDGQADVLAFVEHDSRAVLGRLAAKNLELVEDSHGLRSRSAGYPVGTRHTDARSLRRAPRMLLRVLRDPRRLG